MGRKEKEKGGEQERLKLGLATGAWENEIISLLDSADFKVDRLTPHYAIIEDPRISDGILSSSRDLWTMVSQGDLDAALVPLDDVAEEMHKRPIVKSLVVEPIGADLILIVRGKLWQERGAEIKEILLLLRGVVEARGRVLLKLHIDENRLNDILTLLPSLKAPTVSPLAGSDPKTFAVEAVVPRSEVNFLIPKLLMAGATDLIELPISKLIKGSEGLT
ncbi:MAG: hypothetical protein NZ959_10065 [Armatimonadetes bacterium]|nr:hypothetical protein [Armatimonadota bacterium]MDW8122614.1 hypothetical protein [Armatimonadota bacterium]